MQNSNLISRCVLFFKCKHKNDFNNLIDGEICYNDKIIQAGIDCTVLLKNIHKCNLKSI